MEYPFIDITLTRIISMCYGPSKGQIELFNNLTEYKKWLMLNWIVSFT